MLEVKRFIRKNKKQVAIVGIALLAILVIVVLYKSLFYSNSERSIYGIRTHDIKEHKISNKQINKWKESTLDIDGVTECKINVKGRLIKFFITFDNEISTDDMKTKINDALKEVSDNVKSYYDITIYAKQSKDDGTKYPVIGYKHKTSDSISYDTF